MMTLKNYFFCSCFIFLGCTGSSQSVKSKLKDSLQTAEADKEFTLAPGQVTTINGIEISLLDVNDSRCPSDVDCSWRGTVTLTLNIKKDGKAFDHPLSINLDKTQYLTENYDIVFTGVKPERGKHSQQIQKSDYRVNLLLRSANPSFTITEIKDPVGVIFPKNEPTNRPGLESAQGSWSPSIEDVKKADELVLKYISEPQQLSEDIKGWEPKYRIFFYRKITETFKEDYPKYKRQYFGYLKKDTDHKLIFLNFLKPHYFYHNRIWKKQYLSGRDNDGDEVFWGILVDLEEGKCLISP
ncbi:MAG: hypothetical protein WBP45_00315 [Daejeonella sp.]